MKDISEQTRRTGPILRRNSKGEIGVVMVDLDTKKDASGWLSVDDPTIDLKPYLSDKGKDGVRLDPAKFAEREKAAAAKAKAAAEAKAKAEAEAKAAEAAKPAPKPEAAKPAPKPEAAKPSLSQQYATARAAKDYETADRLGKEIWARRYSGKFTVPSVEKDGPRVNVATTQQQRMFDAIKANPDKPNPAVFKRAQRIGKTMEAYDVVLDYLLSEGHAETLEEAHYVMMQLDSEFIQNIIEN